MSISETDNSREIEILSEIKEAEKKAEEII